MNYWPAMTKTEYVLTESFLCRSSLHWYFTSGLNSGLHMLQDCICKCMKEYAHAHVHTHINRLKSGHEDHSLIETPFQVITEFIIHIFQLKSLTNAIPCINTPTYISSW